MIPRVTVTLAALVLLANPAAADFLTADATFGASSSASVSFAAAGSFSAGGSIAVAAPVPVITPGVGVVPMFAPAPVPVQGRAVLRASRYRPPAPTVVMTPAPVVMMPAPPMVVVTPVTTLALPPTVVFASAPVATGWETECVCDAVCSGCLAAEEEDDATFDLVFLGSYRHALDQGEMGGGLFNPRLLVFPTLSIEASAGYLAGGTYAGGNFEEAPMALSFLWYPMGRDSLLYAGAGLTAGWVSRWADDAIEPGSHPFDGSFENWYAGGRAVVGVELELFDFLLLTGEAEAFARYPIDREDAVAEYGFAFNTGLGLRF